MNYVFIDDLLHSGRFGTFKLNLNFLAKADANLVLKALEKAFITRCEYRFDTDCFEYIAYHPSFDVVEEGNEPNDYDLVLITELSIHYQNAYFKWVKHGK